MTGTPTPLWVGLLVIIAILAVVIVGLGQWLNKLQVDVRRLRNELRLRQLYAEARRHDLAVLLQIFDGTVFTNDELERELESQARAAGLTTEGLALGGFSHPRPLLPVEWAELATLAGVPGAVRS